MGVCRLCKYHTTPKQLKDNNEWLSDLIKRKIEQDKNKEETEGTPTEPVEDEEPTPESPSDDEEEETEGDSTEDNSTEDDNITTYEDDGEPIEDNTGEPSEGTPEDSVEDTNENLSEDTPENTPSTPVSDEIEIPEDACFKFVLPPPLPIPFTPLRLRREKFLPPPITPMDMMHLCSNPEHIKKDHIKGDEWLACCAIFNRFEECLLFEEANSEETSETPSDAPASTDDENENPSLEPDPVAPDEPTEEEVNP